MRRCRAWFTAGVVSASSLPLAGCGGPLSALDPAGPAAAAIAELWWVMLIGAVGLFVLVMGLLLWTFVRRGDGTASPKLWLVGGGLVLPALVLTPLLGYGLLTGERLLAYPATDALRVDVEAKQWQWTFRYPGQGGGRISVNELHIPAGRPVDLRVSSADVIHSFWIPRLGGKIDAIPGHVNLIRLSAARPGIYRGVCAEFCGTGHTIMDFSVTAHDAGDYDDRLRALPQEQR
ncbi:cytochrome c oxidase subunit II [Rhodopseudomonas palustris]|uniref:cytochrome c oxidase subunit II n=1 Tax=Rhodopseudomonas palustris TaxID=1076 RepID=UPI002ACD899A|nr:cytochrome c oxidase subunit II [Rhodopseudomonas palustris]WQG98873.1 cytochrome c oxidase subunit II [Rhodopseudomonas palustris]